MRYLWIVFCMMLFLTGCSSTSTHTGPDEPVTPEITIAKYIQDKGYKIISAEGRTQKYELTKEKLKTLPYMMYWGLQKVDPMQYIGKTIEVYKYIVKNHPLDQWTSNGVTSKKQTELYVYYVDKKVIGGTSFPVVDVKLHGGMWSLEGKTLEEVQEKDYATWRDEWLEKLNRP